jgi:hypothetical protein
MEQRKKFKALSVTHHTTQTHKNKVKLERNVGERKREVRNTRRTDQVYLFEQKIVFRKQLMFFCAVAQPLFSPLFLLEDGNECNCQHCPVSIPFFLSSFPIPLLLFPSLFKYLHSSFFPSLITSF